MSIITSSYCPDEKLFNFNEKEIVVPCISVPYRFLGMDNGVRFIKYRKKGWFRMFFKKKKELENELAELRKHFHQLSSTVSVLKAEFMTAQNEVGILKILNGKIPYKTFQHGWDQKAYREKIAEEGYVLEGCIGKGEVEIWVKREKSNG